MKSIFSTFLSIKFSGYLKVSLCLAVLLLFANVNSSAQSYPGQGGRLGGNQSGSSLKTAIDSVQKPPLKVDYFEIDELGFIDKRIDSIDRKGLRVDLLQDDIDHLGLGNYYSATLPIRFDFKLQRGNKLGIRSYDIYQPYVPTGIIISPNRPLVSGYYGTRFEDGHRNINLDFSRTFARKITFGFRIFSGDSDGQYTHQSASFNAIEFNVLQRSKKDRRISYLHFHIHRNKELLNGGLSNPQDIFTRLPGGNLSYNVINDDADLNLKKTTFRMGTSITLGVDSIQQKWDTV